MRTGRHLLIVVTASKEFYYTVPDGFSFGYSGNYHHALQEYEVRRWDKDAKEGQGGWVASSDGCTVTRYESLQAALRGEGGIEFKNPDFRLKTGSDTVIRMTINDEQSF